MKVLLIFRPQIPGNFSFENIFNAVSLALSKRIHFNKVHAQSFFDPWTPLSLLFRTPDVFHITGAVNYFALFLPGAKTILTVHDIGAIDNCKNKGIKKWIYEWLWFRLPFQRVSFITTVSDFTKQRLIAYFKVPESKITVIPNPVLSHFQKKKNSNSSVFTILQIGSGAHKNILSLLKTVHGMPNIHLLLVAKLSLEEKEYLESSGISHELYFDVKAEKLLKFYQRADLLYFASLYEGFGMPIIEANAVGVPVITSNRGAMKEVARDAALLVDPGCREEIKQAIYLVQSNEDLRKELVIKGFENAQRYSIDAISEKYFELYKKAAVR